jgi:hypothetical protein
MKTRAVALVISLLLTAGVASAASLETVLTPDSAFFAISVKDGAKGIQPRLELTRRQDEVRTTLVVPGTDDAELESDARLGYDSCSDTLFVLWHRSGQGVDEIRLATLNGAGEWSEPYLVASGAQVHRAGLQMVLTHARGANATSDATLVHAAWWDVGGGTGADTVPRYAIVAFEKGQHYSTDVERLDELAAIRQVDGEATIEDTGAVLHPPLALTREGKSVDVVFGGDRTTAITRVRIDPRQYTSNARMWRPSGRNAMRTEPAHLTSADSSPVQAFLSSGRIVLYTPDSQFRFIVLDNGKWTPIRMIELDESLTTDELLHQLRKTVEESQFTTAAPQSE